jgi:hypothetical protein
MAKHTVRFPQKGDRVGAIGREGVFVVIGVHENPNMADLRPLKGGDGTRHQAQGKTTLTPPGGLMSRHSFVFIGRSGGDNS